MKNKFYLAMSLAVVLAMLFTFVGLAAELVTAELTGTANDVTVTQGTSTSFTISVSATGSVACTQTAADPSTATVDTVYAISAGGGISSNTPSSALDFFATTPCSGTNGAVTWVGAPAAYSVNASVTAAATTPLGTYTITLSQAAGTTDETNPNTNGGKLEDTNATTIKVHVVAPSIQNQAINVTTAAPASATYGSSFNVAATATSGLPVAITTTGVCTGSGTGSASITLTSGTGTCTVYYNQAGNTSYNPAPQLSSNTTAQKANANCSISGYSGVYDGNPHGASGTCSGTGSYNYGASFTDVPGGTANWSYAGDDNYNSDSGSVNIVITKAPAGCTITGYTGTYDGNAHGANGSCTGDGTLNLGNQFINVPGGTAHWSFTGDGNHEDASGSVAVNISKADAIIVVNEYSGVYDGNAHGVTGTATGVKGESLSGLDLGASFTNVPGGVANWSFTDVTGNYNNDSGTADVTISKADATINVSGYTGTYDGNAHGATGTATGVKGEALSGLNLGASFTNVPGGTANWTFTDSTGNYNNDSGNVAITINKADATCSISGYTGIFDGAAHGASGSCSGIGGESAGILNLGATFTFPPGGTANWTFTGNGNYKDQSGNIAINISAWTLKGFYQPVDMNGVFNTVKGGSTVPLKFEVFAGDTELTNTTAVKSFTAAKATCDAGAPLDDIELTTTGGTSLRYDTTAGQFIQNWQTPKGAGLCYKVTMTTQDGSFLSALFKTK